MTKDVEPVAPNFLNEMPEEVRSALALIGVTEITEAVDAEEITGGWRVLKDKEYLVGRPFYIVKMSFNDSDYARFVDGKRVDGKFVTLHIITDDPEHDRFVVSDGSTGVCESAIKWAQLHGDPTGKMIHCKRGFRVSNYTYREQVRDKSGALVFQEDGEPEMAESPASTYYFD